MPKDLARLLKTVYGVTNAPREFYKDVKRKVEDKKINAIPILFLIRLSIQSN